MFSDGQIKSAKARNELYSGGPATDNGTASICSYKELSLRKQYRKVSLQYTLILLAVLALDLTVLIISKFYNPAFIGFIIFTAAGALLRLLDLFFFRFDTRSLDNYTKTLNTENLSRIEKHTGKLGRYNQLVFLESEMLFIQSSCVKVYEYSRIESVKEKAPLIELYDSNNCLLGAVPLSGRDAASGWEKVMTISKLAALR